MKKLSKYGFMNPLNFKKLNFNYEVLKSGEVKEVEYEYNGDSYIQSERPLTIKFISGYHGGNVIYCMTYDRDALKPLREGDLVSAELYFSVKKDDNGNCVQKVTAENVYTLTDFYQLREADAFYRGGLEKEQENAD